MDLTYILKEIIYKYSKNKHGEYQVYSGVFWIILLPLAASIISIYAIGPESVFNSGFTQIYISIISIFAAFYISLLVYMNQKINEIDITIINDQTKKNNCTRLVNNSKKLTINLLYSLICIIISITIILIANLKFSTNISFISKWVTIIGGFIEYFTLYSIIIQLFKIVRNSQTDFLKDIKEKSDEILSKKI